jgi:dihydropyrimidinase
MSSLIKSAKFVCAPPIRDDPLDNQGIWDGIANGTFTVFSSDHAPTNFHDENGKQLGLIKNPLKNCRGDFRSIPNGLPGIGTRTPLLWSEGVLKGRIKRQKFVELNSSNAAKLYGLYPKKGTIQPGSDADFVIWHPKATPTTIKQDKLHHGADYTPYEDMLVGDWPRLVLLRGKIAYDGDSNQVIAPTGTGQFLKRGFSTLPGPRGHSSSWINGFVPHA